MQIVPLWQTFQFPLQFIERYQYLSVIEITLILLLYKFVAVL